MKQSRLTEAQIILQTEEAFGRGDARPGRPEGCRCKKMVTPDAKREAVAHFVVVHGISQRRACEVLAVDRSSIRYRSVRPDDAAERAAMKAIAAERRRFGYRRIHIMLERQGIMMNLKKLRRLYNEAGLQVRKRGGLKRALGTRRPIVVPQAANERWSLEFASRTFGSSAMPLRTVGVFRFWPWWMISRRNA